MLRIEIVVAAIVVIGIAAYLFGKRHAWRLQHRRRIRIDRFKLKRRHADIELEVFGSREVVQAVQAYAREHRVTTEAAMKQAKAYLREIVPKFNLLAYYRIGAPVASALMRFLYRPVVEQEPLPRGSVIVFIINHRSNADYVLVAHMLFEFVSLSYAVGEWARVWPLNHIFKWFGAYFIRRRYREPLYHAVLSTFVSTITRNGVTQGIFIEGGLTRDGAFLRPKIGMLDYIVSAKRDPEFTAPLVLIPTAINYDRVLEDRHLTEELLGHEDRSTRSERLRTTLGFLFKNFWRGVFRRFKRFGYAVVSFGEPLIVDEFLRQHPNLTAGDFAMRKPELQTLAETMMTRISAAIPLTPVTLAARVFADSREPLSDVEIGARIDALRQASPGRWRLRETNGIEAWRAAKRILELRRLIVAAERWRSDLFEGEGVPVVEDVWQWNPAELLLRDYYANSLRGFPDVQHSDIKTSTQTVQ